MGNQGSSAAGKLPPLTVAPSCDTAKFMGTWFVIAVKPTALEKTCSNAVEKYTWLTEKDDKASNHDIDIDFRMNRDVTPSSRLISLPQKGWIHGTADKRNSAEWRVSPLWPIKMPYLILEVDTECPLDEQYTIIGYPSREYCWIMGRHPVMSDAKYTELTKLLMDKHQYDLSTLRKVPQLWTAEERTKRGLTKTEIPDHMLIQN